MKFFKFPFKFDLRVPKSYFLPPAFLVGLGEFSKSSLAQQWLKSADQQQLKSADQHSELPMPTLEWF